MSAVVSSADELGSHAADLGYELNPLGTAARIATFERVDAAVAQLADAGAASEILHSAAASAATALALDRVLLSRVDDGALIAEALHWSSNPTAAADALTRLRAAPIDIGYPVVEGEVLRRRRPASFTDADQDDGARHAGWDIMRWRAYIVAPIVLSGRPVGLIHGDRLDTAPASEDLDALARFARGFSLVFERAVLMRRLRLQRQELRQVASWADARSVELSDGVIDLAPDGEIQPARDPIPTESRLHDLLTRREAEVLEHLVRGEANAQIARSLVVSEGTVKFHVKNILRKLNVSNRAEATAYYLRFSLRGEN